jgi:hypothetical protein
VIRRIAVTAALVASAGLLTACGAGNAPQTSKSAGSVQGVADNFGSVDIRDAAVVVDSGKAYVQMTLVNTGSDADTLQSVLTSASPAVSINTGSSVALPAGQAVAFGEDTLTQLYLTQVSTTPTVGSIASLSLSFKLAGDTTLQVPVLAYDELTK